jgi:hypothetical protein
MLRRPERPSRSASIAIAAFALILSTSRFAATGETIRIWKIGSPHRGDTPDTRVPAAFASDAVKRDLGLHIEAFPAQGFATIFVDAFQRRTAPDLLVFDNFGVINGGRTDLGHFDGIGEDPVIRKDLIHVTGTFDELLGPDRGWTYLVASSAGHGAARALALKPPQCSKGSSPPKLDGELAEIVPEFVAAYLAGDSDRLQQYSDPDRLAGARPNSETVRVHQVRPCGAWASDRLAFALVNASYEAETKLGHTRVLLVLRKHSSTWRLLVAARDPISNDEFAKDIPSLVARLERDEQPPSVHAPATSLLPADGSYPRPSAGQRFGDFTWHSSPASDVVAEIAEFAYDDDARLFLTTRRGAGSVSQVSAGRLWSTRRFWTWRIWSVTRAGDLVFSESRRFLN